MQSTWRNVALRAPLSDQNARCAVMVSVSIGSRLCENSTGFFTVGKDPRISTLYMKEVELDSAFATIDAVIQG